MLRLTPQVTLADIVEKAEGITDKLTLVGQEKDSVFLFSRDTVVRAFALCNRCALTHAHDQPLVSMSI
jgi:hypothetical protein